MVIDFALALQFGLYVSPATEAAVVHHLGFERAMKALVFNSISHTVMMCTPRDLEAFAVGFSLTEGIVERGSDIQDIEVYYRNDGVALPHAEVHLQIGAAGVCFA